MEPKVITVILNWNGYADSIECINSILKIKYKNYEILLVDNGSDSKEYEKITSLNSKAKIIRSKINLGFTGGNNLGIKYALEEKADYILLLNNDTTVEPNFLEPLLNLFKKEKNAGIVAPQINYFSEPQKIWSAGGKISRLRGSGFASSDRIESRIKPDNKSVSFVSGCCMLIKKEVFEKIGLFDENFFLYVEDADLCYRTTHAGYKIIVNHHSKILHKVSSSTKENLSLLPLYYVTRNRLYFAKKNFPNFFIITVLYIVFSMSIKSIYWIFSNNSKNILILISAFKDYFSKRMGKSSLLSFK